MQETSEELRELRALPDASLSRSTSYPRAITNTERTLTAERLTQVLLHPHWTTVHAPVAKLAAAARP